MATARAATTAVIVLAAITSAGCKGEHAEPRARSSAALDELEVCAGLFSEIQAAPAGERSSVFVERSSDADTCALMFSGCEPRGPVSSDANSARQLRARTDACLAAYCDRLEPRPALCDDPDASEILTVDVEAAYAEFIAAKLASDLDLPRDHPRIVAVAGAFAPIWASPTMMGRIRVSPPRDPPTPTD